MKVHCRLCNDYVEIEKFDNHYKKCCSIDYIQRKMKQLYNKDVTREEILKLDFVEFNKRYFWLLNRVYENTIDPKESARLENILYGANHELKDLI